MLHIFPRTLSKWIGYQNSCTHTLESLSHLILLPWKVVGKPQLPQVHFSTILTAQYICEWMILIICQGQKSGEFNQNVRQQHQKKPRITVDLRSISAAIDPTCHVHENCLVVIWTVPPCIVSHNHSLGCSFNSYRLFVCRMQVVD